MLKFLETAFETRGERHVQEARYPAHSPVPPYHCHPKQAERFEVHEGALRFRVDGEERDVRAGEAIDIPRGTDHLVHNPHEEAAVVVWTTRPALRTADFFWEMSEAAKGRARPGVADAAAILREYGDVFQLASPPRFVQRMMFGCLAPFGSRPVR
ncbi:MAG: cupin protein [Labilithrix sp.]|nr:cupin protein [Labilithrix sp.]